MPTCTPTEFMILSFIFRQTAGFNKPENKLSYNQIRHGTGIKGQATISKSLDGLTQKKYITRRGKYRGSIWYGLNQDLEIVLPSSSEIEPDGAQLAQKLTSSSSEIEPDGAQLAQKLTPSSSEIEPDGAQLAQKLNSSSSEIEPDEAQLVQKLNSSSSEIEPDEAQLVQKLNSSSSEFELDGAHLVQILNTSKDTINKDILKQQQQQQHDHDVADLKFSNPEIDHHLGECHTAYKNNIGSLGPLHANDFNDLYNGLSPPMTETKLMWFEYAILAATSNGINKWSYIKAVIEGIKNTGSLAKHKDGRNGQNPTKNSKWSTTTTAPNGNYTPPPSPTVSGDTPHTGLDSNTESKLHSLFGL